LLLLPLMTSSPWPLTVGLPVLLLPSLLPPMARLLPLLLLLLLLLLPGLVVLLHSCCRRPQPRARTFQSVLVGLPPSKSTTCRATRKTHLKRANRTLTGTHDPTTPSPNSHVGLFFKSL
jgi:hypothetical protein